MFCFLNSILDIEIHPGGLGTYCKPINTGQYTHCTSFSSRAIKLHGSLIIQHATVIVMKQKFKLNSKESRKLSLGMVFQNG